MTSPQMVRMPGSGGPDITAAQDESNSVQNHQESDVLATDSTTNHSETASPNGESET